MRIFVTGSNGFLGGRVATLAARDGWEVIGSGRAAQPVTPVAGYLRHDLTAPVAGMPSVLAGGVDAVVHCAALASPWARPAAFVAANVTGTAHLIQLCRRLGDAPGRGEPPPLVHVSSSSVLYRLAHQFHLTETSPIPPDAQQLNAYSRSKLLSERLVAAYPGRWSIARPRAVFGPGDRVLLPRILAAAHRGVLPLLEPANGPAVVGDLTFVDTAASYLLAMARTGVRGHYNLTNGEPVPLYPFLLSVLRQLGLRPRLRRVPVPVAMAAAGAAEAVSAVALRYREPPLTRFGVAVLGYSKTFEVTRCRRDLGPPSVGLAEGVQRLVRATPGGVG